MLKLVIADNHEPSRRLLCRMLESVPDVMVIGEACDGEQLCRYMSVAEPDIVLVDIDMPVIDGVESVRQCGRTRPELKVIFTTCYDDYAVDAFELSAVDYIMKPVDLNKLLAALE